MPPCHRITAPPHHRITVSVSHLSCPLPPNQSVIYLAPCHQTSQSFALPPTTTSPHHCVTAPPHHRITALVSHLPCPLPPSQSLICLASCHQTSQSFSLQPTTVSLRHRVSQSFALPPATKPVTHLPCPLPPNQSVICLATYHRVTASPRHRVSQSFALPPATKPVSHLPRPLPPNQSVICLAPYHRITASPHHCTTAPPCHRTTTSPRHRISQSFTLPPATKPVTHLPCLLPPNQSVICLATYHRVTASPC